MVPAGGDAGADAAVGGSEYAGADIESSAGPSSLGTWDGEESSFDASVYAKSSKLMDPLGAAAAATKAHNLPAMDIEPLKGRSVAELLSEFPTPPGVVIDEGLSEAEELEKFQALMVRACKGANLIAASERTELDEWMVKKAPATVESLQREVHQSFLKGAKGLGKSIAKKVTKSNIPVVELSKYWLDFGGYSRSNVCPLARELTQTIKVTNKTKNKAKLSLIMPAETYGYTFIADVTEALLKKKQSVDITFSLKVDKGSAVITHVVVVEVEGGARHLVPINIVAEDSVFGIPHEQQIVVEDNGFSIPQPLALLRAAFLANGGLTHSNIFRGSVLEDELQDTKDLLNRKQFTANSTTNIEIIAALIKVWYRECEPNLLNTVPIESFDACDSEAQCLELLESIPEPHLNLLKYLLVFLADVARNESVNGMSVRNLSIAMAPNLINLDDISPIEALTISQRVVGWLYMCLSSTLHTLALSTT
ncbi:uncharacterized protein AMSG_11801 [Thecamonas trahens ATCC 50062]|uniref:Rho-GAP domain-containing protein n=1 Tax=Thecamonas trahens ATCC 50062 TaxID=461836 RepID=A0A0L0D6V0_THETB|nr:hypothetical protein AMSG_11801 [Thecamonas trahens ATCC 50062]KNC48082.1 hypothetical protein AMSG_11801 [Thecamonas trahens ATCC 50062]|eukprot:XP_013759119.1 hypothetical protein AMSG_11801 [Thecamonas trahens ATCC 50062]